MPRRTAVTSLAGLCAILGGIATGIWPGSVHAEGLRISANAMFRDIAEFSGDPSIAKLAQATEGRAPEAGPEPKSPPGEPASRPADARPRYKDGVYLVNGDYWLGYPLNVWRFFSAPARFNEKEWFIAVATGAAAGVLVALDDEIREFWQDNVTGGTSRDVFDVFNFLGEGKFQIPTILGGYALAELVDQTGMMDTRRAKSAFILAAQAGILTQALVFGIKYVSGRDRPNENDDQNAFHGPANGTNKAFPSGHASAAFALAGTFSEVYKDEYPWVPWVLYPIAAGTALSRIDRDKHWASDVFVGGLIGYLMAATVVKYSPFLEENNISFRPMNLEEGNGAILVKRF